MKIRLVAVLAFIVLLGVASSTVYARYRVHLLVADENNPNPVKAEKLATISVAISSPVPFQREVLDNRKYLGGRKGKVIIDPDGHGAVPGAQVGPLGFALYRPGKPATFITPFSLRDGLEDAQAVDVNADGAPDIVAGGLGNDTYVLMNPHGTRCPDAYRCRWRTIMVDTGHFSHDVLTADIDRDGAPDIVTEGGVYFNRDRGQNWLFAGRGQISRDGEGTSTGDLAGDHILDIVAPYMTGTKLARFINPLHSGGDPAKDTWRPQVIDEHPLFTGNMTTAISDVNGDGRNDVLLAPMYGGGGLVWYEAPASPDGAWQRHVIDPTVNFVHQGSLQIADFDGDGHPDIAFAEQDQSPTGRIGVFYNVNGNATSWRLQVLSTEGGHNIKAGRIGGDRFPSILSARHGVFHDADPLLLFRNLKR